MPLKMFNQSGKYILIPILISDTIRKELAKRLEEVILAHVKLLQGGTLKEDIRLDPMEFKSSSKPVVISKKDHDIFIESMYSIVDGNGLANLLKSDLHKSTQSKIGRLFGSFRTILYRKFIAKMIPAHSKVDVIWKEEFSHVVLDKSDIEKAGLTLPINPRIIKTLQNRGWKNIVVYEADEQKLHIYTPAFPYGREEQL